MAASEAETAASAAGNGSRKGIATTTVVDDPLTDTQALHYRQAHGDDTRARAVAMPALR